VFNLSIDFFQNMNPDLKYCFIDRELNKKMLTPRGLHPMKGDVAFNIKVSSLQKKLNLPDSYKNIYLLNGSSIFDFSMIPLSQKILIISNQKNAEEKDLNQVMEHEIVHKFIEYKENKGNHHTTELSLNTMDLQHENLNNTCQEVLNIVENTYQLNSHQLGKLVDLSKYC